MATGLMQTRPITDEHLTHEYVLTDKGLDLQAVIVALSEWGDRWAAPQGPPISYQHETCGGRIHQQLTCEDCNVTLVRTQVNTRPGPGANSLSG